MIERLKSVYHFRTAGMLISCKKTETCLVLVSVLWRVWNRLNTISITGRTERDDCFEIRYQSVKYKRRFVVI